MKRIVLTTCLLFAGIAISGVSHAATVLIDFDSVATGEYNPGDVVVTVGALQVSIVQGTVGNPRNGGTIVAGGATTPGAPFSGRYFTSASTALNQNDGRLDLSFSIPIVGTVTLDANYQSTAGDDFRVIDLLTGTVVHAETDGPNTKSLSFTLATPTTELRFRDSDVFSVEIDNLTVTTVPVPAAVWLFVSALGLLGWVRRRAV